MESVGDLVAGTRSMRYPDFVTVNLALPLERPYLTPALFRPAAAEPLKILNWTMLAALPVAVKALLEQPHHMLTRSHPHLALLKASRPSAVWGWRVVARCGKISRKRKIHGSHRRFAVLGLP